MHRTEVIDLGGGSWVVVLRRAVPSTAAQFDAVWQALCPAEYVKVKIHGRDVDLARHTRAFGSGDGYTYSGQTQDLDPVPEPVGRVQDAMTAALRPVLRPVVHDNADEHGNAGAAPPFNMCLVNFYRDGSAYCGYHCDDTRQLLPHSPIACVSWGATRRFILKPRLLRGAPTAGCVQKAFDLADGDVVVMGGRCQETHKHTVPKTALTRCSSRRMSFTFRCFAERPEAPGQLWHAQLPPRPAPAPAPAIDVDSGSDDVIVIT